MATRIRPLPSPLEPAAPHLDPGAALLLAPPSNLNKRLRAAVHRSLPGWTVEVLVKQWNDTHVNVVINGLRDAGGLAPPAPPTGSAEAEKLASRVARVAERIVEEEQPGTDWVVAKQYFSTEPDRFRLHITGYSAGKKNDPPTCIDGAGKVIFPDEARLVGKTTVIAANKTDVDRWVFFHWFAETSMWPSSPPAQGWTALAVYAADRWPNVTPQIDPPVLLHLGQPQAPINLRTFACLVAANGGELSFTNNQQMANWWVWSEAMLSVRAS